MLTVGKPFKIIRTLLFTMKKELFGWSMYDFANTIFSALFVTIYFPLIVVLSGGTEFHVGLVFSVSMLLAALVVPTLGAVADITGRKKLLLFIFTAACCFFTFITGFAGLIAILVFGLLANLFYHAGLDIYDSILSDISNRKNIGNISGIGTAFGYMGTILAVIVAALIGFFLGFESPITIKIMFAVTAILFFGFSLPIFFLIKEKSSTKIRIKHFKEGIVRVKSTIRNFKDFKYVWLFLLASFLYVDAANTMIIFLFLFGRDQIGLSLSQFLPLYIIMSLAAILGAFVFGKITDKLGHKKTLLGVLILWILVILALSFRIDYSTFIFAGIFGGFLLGAIWTITRPLLVQLVPKDKIAELFGYQGLTEKLGGVIGPVIFGFIATYYSFRYALYSVVFLFILGAIALYFVKTGPEKIKSKLHVTNRKLRK
jgi:MFS transporter, UMF1 family